MRDFFVLGSLHNEQTFVVKSPTLWLLDKPEPQQSKNWLVDASSLGIAIRNGNVRLLDESAVDADKTNGIELTNSKGWKAYLQHDTTYYWLNSNVDEDLSGSRNKVNGFCYGYLVSFTDNGLNDALENAKRKGYTRDTDTIQSTITQTTMKGKTIMNDLITKLKKLTRKEPEKSLIEQGVTDESGVLTTEGYKAFVQFLFDSEDNKKAFYEGVVKPIVDAEKK